MPEHPGKLTVYVFQIEREMGSGGFFILYFAAGIFGLVKTTRPSYMCSPFFSNVLGGNFSLVGVPSVGASGAIFGTLAVRSGTTHGFPMAHLFLGYLGRPFCALEDYLQTSAKSMRLF